MIYFMVVFVTIALFPLPSVRVRPKGQLISECPFDVMNFSKEQTKKNDKFLPKNLKSRKIIRKDTPFNMHFKSYINFSIIKNYLYSDHFRF